MGPLCHSTSHIRLNTERSGCLSARQPHTATTSGSTIQLRGRCVHPSAGHFAIAIDELHVLQRRPNLEQSREARVSCSCRGEWDTHVQPHEVRTQTARRVAASIGGSRVHIYDRAIVRGQGLESSDQSCTLVAPDEDDSGSR